jgi:hypothetical protein
MGFAPFNKKGLVVEDKIKPIKLNTLSNMVTKMRPPGPLGPNDRFLCNHINHI